MFAFLATFSLIVFCNAQVEEVDVIIMGAGMAGIAAGHVLNSFGMDNFTIIEAQEYIGGRTRTVEFGGHGLSAGASWISGACYGIPNPNFECRYDGCNPTTINPMLTIALDNNFQFERTDIHEWNHPPYPPYLSGPNRNDIYSNAVLEAEYRKWWNAQSCLDILIDNIESGWEDDVSYYDGLGSCFWREPLNNIEKSIQWAEFDLEFAYSIHEYSVSMSYGETYCLYGNQDLYVTDPRGYQGVTLQLASDYLDLDNIANDPKIELNSPIELIEYGKDGGVTVTIADTGKQYHAKYGLVTFSVGVLQGRFEDVVSFEPALPQWKRTAIEATGFADYIAVYVKFPYVFWELDHPEISESEIVVLVGETYGYFGWFLNIDYLIPGSLIWRFDCVEQHARDLQQQSVATTTAQLTAKFNSYFNVVVPEFDVFVGNWSVNQYVQGAYAAYPVDYDWDRYVSDMQWPADEVLYFGGEHTNYDDSGYVHTAYFTGKRAGESLLDCLGYSNGGGYHCQGPHSQRKYSNTSRSRKHSRRNKKPKYGY